MILVIRIAGRPKNKQFEDETLQRLNLIRKFNAVLIDDKNASAIGMIKTVKHMTAYGRVSEEFIKELKKKRPAKANGKIFTLHPPIGGFKKSSKLPFPKGILGEHEDITKLAGRMLGVASVKQA